MLTRNSTEMARKLSSAELILRAARSIEIMTAEKARPLGLTSRQIDVLLTLAEEPGLSQREIMVRCYVDRSTLSQIVRRLQKRKLINVKTSKMDARESQNYLTDLGMERAEVAREVRQQVDNEVAEVVGGAQAFGGKLQAVYSKKAAA